MAGALLCVGVPATVLGAICGQTIMQSVTLTADETCGSTVVVGADGITIDLGGFTISGDGSFVTGIDVNGHSGVTIKNGTLRFFTFGIVANATDKLRLSRLVVHGMLGLGAIIDGAAVTVEKSFFYSNDQGGLRLTGRGGKISNSTFLSNGLSGLFVVDAPGSKITKITSASNVSDGVRVSGPGVSVRSSTLAANHAAGIRLTAASGCDVSKNTMVGNGDTGITALDSPTVAANRNVIAGNLIAGNDSQGVRLIGDSNGNVVTKNRLIGNREDGIFVDFLADGTLVKGNTAIGNIENGIFNRNNSTTIAKNVVDANSGNGIFDIANAFDGGGNKARANGLLVQCSPGIACPPAFTAKAGPTIPFCGMLVSTSIKLGADLFCANADGLIVDADDVTIDLNGHRLESDRQADQYGIFVGPHKNVTIKNGVVRRFDFGIYANADSDGLRVINVEVRESLNDGLRVEGGGGTVKNAVFVANSRDGAFFAGPSSPLVTSSFFVANGDDGVDCKSDELTTLTKVTAAVNAGDGVDLTGIFSAAIFKGGIVAANGQTGIVADDFSSRATISKTLVAGNERSGIDFGDEPVIPLPFFPGDAHVDGSLVVGNVQHGIRSDSPRFATNVSKNTITGNALAGLFLGDDANNPAVVQNKTIANGTHGVHNNVANASFAKNLAQANAGFGIFTSQPVIDGGGNRAFHNGAVDQCSPPLVCLGMK